MRWEAGVRGSAQHGAVSPCHDPQEDDSAGKNIWSSHVLTVIQNEWFFVTFPKTAEAELGEDSAHDAHIT